MRSHYMIYIKEFKKSRSLNIYLLTGKANSVMVREYRARDQFMKMILSRTGSSSVWIRNSSIAKPLSRILSWSWMHSQKHDCCLGGGQILFWATHTHTPIYIYIYIYIFHQQYLWPNTYFGLWDPDHSESHSLCCWCAVGQMVSLYIKKYIRKTMG